MLARHEDRVKRKANDAEAVVGHVNEEPLYLSRLIGADTVNPLAVEPPAMVKSQPLVQGLTPPRRE
jgi:hypothetical protein